MSKRSSVGSDSREVGLLGVDMRGSLYYYLQWVVVMFSSRD